MKKLLLSSIIVIIGFTFIGRLSYLQLFRFSPDQILDDPAIKKIYDYPERGYIYDRDGKLMVGNQPAYDVMVIPREVKPLDTLEFCQLLGIDKLEFPAKWKKQGIIPQGCLLFWYPNYPRRIMQNFKKKCDILLGSISKKGRFGITTPIVLPMFWAISVRRPPQQSLLCGRRTEGKDRH